MKIRGFLIYPSTLGLPAVRLLSIVEGWNCLIMLNVAFLWYVCAGCKLCPMGICTCGVELLFVAPLQAGGSPLRCCGSNTCQPVDDAMGSVSPPFSFIDMRIYVGSFPRIKLKVQFPLVCPVLQLFPCSMSTMTFPGRWDLPLHCSIFPSLSMILLPCSKDVTKVVMSVVASFWFLSIAFILSILVSFPLNLGLPR